MNELTLTWSRENAERIADVEAARQDLRETMMDATQHWDAALYRLHDAFDAVYLEVLHNTDRLLPIPLQLSLLQSPDHSPIAAARADSDTHV